MRDKRGECGATGGLSMCSFSFCEPKLLTSPAAGVERAINALETAPLTLRNPGI